MNRARSHATRPRPSGEGWSSTFGSTRCSLGGHPGDGDPDQNRSDGHEADQGRDDSGYKRSPVNALDAYSHQYHQGVGKGEGTEYGYPREYQGGGSVGRHAVDLPKAGHLPDEGPDGE